MVLTRYVIAETAPASLALMRYVIGVACLAVPVLLAGRISIARRDLVPIAALGIVQFGVLIALLNTGLRWVPSGRAALIFALFPLLTMLIAAALDHERLSIAKSIGVLLTIAGVALALGEKLLAPGRDDAPAPWLGELLVFGAALAGAACSVLYRPYLRRYPVLPVGAFAMLASVAFLAVPAALEGFFAAWPHLTVGGWMAVLAIGVGSGAGYVVWLWALRHNTPTRAASFQTLSPITAALLGPLLLDETVTPWLLGGLACVVLGLWVAHWESPSPIGRGQRA